MSTLHEYDEFSVQRDCTCGWKSESRESVGSRWRDHVRMEQGLSADYDPSKSRLQSADSALDRASIPAMFNVVGDELRKMNEKMDGLDLRMAAKVYVELGVKVLQKRLDNAHEDINSRSVDFEHNLSNHLKAMEERMQAQLTALRAEADRQRIELENNSELAARMLDSLENRIMEFHNDFKRNADRWTTRLDMGDIYHAIKGKKSALEQLRVTHKEAKKRTRKIGGK